MESDTIHPTVRKAWPELSQLHYRGENGSTRKALLAWYHMHTQPGSSDVAAGSAACCWGRPTKDEYATQLVRLADAQGIPKIELKRTNCECIWHEKKTVGYCCIYVASALDTSLQLACQRILQSSGFDATQLNRATMNSDERRR